MKTRTLMIMITVLMLATGSSLAQMGGGGHMGGGTGWGSMGTVPNTAPASGYGNGYGMGGAGGMISGMMGNTIIHGYLDILYPITNEGGARTVINSFIKLAYSNLQISELWEYGTAYKAELSDTHGARAFDLVVDKFTGAVSPEMGMSMMLNASYGKGLYKTYSFGIKLALTPERAKEIAQQFAGDNNLGYTLGTPETYPGYYKFHTTKADADDQFGMDIMVNGYNGGIWMNTFLGLPLHAPVTP